MISTAIATGLSLAALWIVGFFLYRSYRVDMFRQNMFALRDELFDLARNGAIQFNHPAYCTLRTLCNGYIRFGHRLNISGAVLMAVGTTPAEREWLKTQDLDERLKRFVGDIDPQTARDLFALKERMHSQVGSQLIFGSPVLVATVVPAVLFAAIIWFQVELVKTLWRRFGEPLDVAAHRLGEAT